MQIESADDFIWTEWNVNHIARHGVTREEVALVLDDKYMLVRKAHSGRHKLLGRSGARLLSVIVAEEEKGYFVVTARDMSKIERTIYRKEKNEV